MRDDPRQWTGSGAAPCLYSPSRFSEAELDKTEEGLKFALQQGGPLATPENLVVLF